MTPQFVIVGSGRSGSGYISQVLTAAGVPCGHEAWWNPQGTHGPDLVGDSSWCALPIGLDDYRGAVFHQVRHPLDVISSLVNCPMAAQYRDLRGSIMPRLPEDPIEFAMLSWLTYTEAAEKHALDTWRLEDVDAELVTSIGRKVGIEPDAERALAQVPTNYNFHNIGGRFDWSDLPAGPLLDAVIDQAATWSYR